MPREYCETFDQVDQNDRPDVKEAVNSDNSEATQSYLQLYEMLSEWFNSDQE